VSDYGTVSVTRGRFGGGLTREGNGSLLWTAIRLSMSASGPSGSGPRPEATQVNPSHLTGGALRATLGEGAPEYPAQEEQGNEGGEASPEAGRSSRNHRHAPKPSG